MGAIASDPPNTNAAADTTCTRIAEYPDPSLVREKENKDCPSVGFQEYKDCWAWASTAQAECNYNLYHQPWIYKEFSQLYTGVCSGAGSLRYGG